MLWDDIGGTAFSLIFFIVQSVLQKAKKRCCEIHIDRKKCSGTLKKNYPRFSEMLITIGNSENDEQRYKDDVVELKFGLVMKCRSFPKGEREGEWGR